MNVTLNLTNIAYRKYLFELKRHQKYLINFVFFKNIYNLHTKYTSNDSNNIFYLKNNNNTNFRKLLVNYKECPKTTLIVRLMSSQSIDILRYERIADQTLDHLNEELELILEESSDLTDGDISLSSGVITLNLGKHGIYVINKQTPNKQIWLSSPISGPKRYDYVDNDWIYKHDGISLYSLLNSELSVILKREIKIQPIAH